MQMSTVMIKDPSVMEALARSLSFKISEWQEELKKSEENLLAPDSVKLRRGVLHEDLADAKCFAVMLGMKGISRVTLVKEDVIRLQYLLGNSDD